MATTIGLVGCGTIGVAVVTGLCITTQNHNNAIGSSKNHVKLDSIKISPRNKEKATALAAKFPDLVEVCTSNQEVVDSCDVVLLAVRPQDAKEVLEQLEFRPNHIVLSLMAVISFDQLTQYCSPAAQLFRCCPLPPAARSEGAIILCAPIHSDLITNLLGMAGTVVEVTNEKDLGALQSVTCLMGPFYNMLKTCQGWLENKGIAGDSAAQYCGAMFQAVANDAKLKSDSASGFQELVEEQTPQGVNEAAIKGLDSRGVFTAYEQVLDLTLGRLNGTVSLDATREQQSTIKDDAWMESITVVDHEEKHKDS